jgi:hypothetical protein
MLLCFETPQVHILSSKEETTLHKHKKQFFFRWLYSPLVPWSLIFQFHDHLQTVGLLGWVISSSQGLYRNTGQHKHRINICTYRTSMPYVRFEPTIPASERAKTVHALDRSATVTGKNHFANLQFYISRITFLELRTRKNKKFCVFWAWIWGNEANYTNVLCSYSNEKIKSV